MKLMPLAMLSIFALSGCMSPAHQPVPAQSCTVGHGMVQTTLYFGMNRPHGPAVTAAEWQSFIDADVTPRFKDGLTVFDARGQWLGEDGQVAREQSKALMLIYTPGQQSSQDVEALRARYRQRFQQESVMRVDVPACVSF
ncbi:DUF3574 domain-containing protein [Erwinia sp. HDF1-3R]|uniref:DUF3574 domain-containing protein n=1 Tax=Erwinia sp. HDF1-3R TaxID=3141543 RepID=UPI0031F52230